MVASKRKIEAALAKSSRVSLEGLAEQIKTAGMKELNVILKGDGRTLPLHFDPRLLEAFRALHREFEAIFERFRD